MGKKRKKRKNKGFLRTLAKYTIKVPVKYTFIGLAKGIKKTYNLTKRTIKKTKKKRKEKQIEESRPQSQPQYQSLKEVKTGSGSLEKFKEELYQSKNKIGLILGARGSGKSALGMNLLENIKKKTNKKVYALGFNKKDLPSWIKVINSIGEIKNNSFLLVDEGGITFSSRSSMSSPNKLLSELLLIARHKNISVLFITQNSSNIEVNTLRQTDFLLLKQSSLLQLDFERKKIKNIYEDIEEQFNKYKDNKSITYIYSDEFQGFVKNQLPSFWSEKVSKAFQNK